jgi:hypothetical protein
VEKGEVRKRNLWRHSSAGVLIIFRYSTGSGRDIEFLNDYGPWESEADALEDLQDAIDSLELEGTGGCRSALEARERSVKP